jgi:hypothetical protein
VLQEKDEVSAALFNSPTGIPLSKKAQDCQSEVGVVNSAVRAGGRDECRRQDYYDYSRRPHHELDDSHGGCSL